MFPAGSLNQAAGAHQLVHGRVDVVDREVEAQRQQAVLF
jgi:hypothetical protein